MDALGHEENDGLCNKRTLLDHPLLQTLYLLVSSYFIEVCTQLREGFGCIDGEFVGPLPDSSHALPRQFPETGPEGLQV